MADEENIYQNTLNHAMEVWIRPEIERRQELGIAPKPFPLQSAQIIFYNDGRPRVIRLNEEVKIVAKAKLKDGIVKSIGESLYSHEIEHYAEVQLPDDEDPNCGHLTLLSIDQQFFIFFDFVYNKGISKKHLDASRQFLRLARLALNEKHLGPCIDTAFSAAELAAKASIYLSPIADHTKLDGHGQVQKRFNHLYKLGHIPEERKNAFNKLSSLRTPARYLSPTFSSSEADCESLLREVEIMISEVSQLIQASPDA